MGITDNSEKIKVHVSSEIGRLRAVLLHRPGVEIERMTPQNAAEALYSDILNKPIVDEEYRCFSGVFERFTKVYYVADLLAVDGNPLDDPHALSAVEFVMKHGSTVRMD